MPRHLTILALLAACTEPPPPPEPPPEVAADLSMPLTAQWPSDHTELRVLESSTSMGALLVALDPGHGSGSNSGNLSSLCIDEQDHNLRLAQHLALSFAAGDHTPPLLTRDSNAGPRYRARASRAQVAGADALISLHSDSRGSHHGWSPAPGLDCSYNDGHPGFAILWSDEGEPALVAARMDLARAIAARMAQAGFMPYDGDVYTGLYGGDPLHPGVFVDRHEPKKRIFMLRRPAMPSVIIETHNAWDRLEEARWQQDATLEAFDAAVMAALSDWGAEG